MNIIYVKFEKINVRNYLFKERSAVFEIFVDDSYNKEIWSKRFNIRNAMASIIKFVIRQEELKHYKLSEGGVRVVIQDKEFVKEVIGNLLQEINKLAEKLDKKDATVYLDTLSRINRLSIDFDKKVKELKTKKRNKVDANDWKDKLSRTRLNLLKRKK